MFKDVLYYVGGLYFLISLSIFLRLIYSENQLKNVANWLEARAEGLYAYKQAYSDYRHAKNREEVTKEINRIK